MFCRSIYRQQNTYALCFCLALLGLLLLIIIAPVSNKYIYTLYFVVRVVWYSSRSRSLSDLLVNFLLTMGLKETDEWMDGCCIFCTEVTLSADALHFITTQGAYLSLLSVRVDSDRTAVQLQSVSFLLVWTACYRQPTVGLGSRRDTATKLVSLRQRHWKVNYFLISSSSILTVKIFFKNSCQTQLCIQSSVCLTRPSSRLNGSRYRNKL